LDTDLGYSIHNSDVSNYKRCRQLWDWSSNLRHNLEPIPQSVNALWFGSGIHEGLYFYYKHDRDLTYAIKAWTRHCDMAPFEVPEEGPHSLTLGTGMLENFATWEAQRKDKLIFIEAERESHQSIFDNGHKKRYLNYRLDGLFQDEQGRYWIREYKTAIIWAGNYDYLLMDDQTGRYLWGEQQRTGKKIVGVDYIILRKATPKHLSFNKNGMFSIDKRQDTTYTIAIEDIKVAWRISPLGLSWTQYKDQYREYLEFLYDKPDNFIKQEFVWRNQFEIKAIEESLRIESGEMVSDPPIYRNPRPENCNNCGFFGPCLARWGGQDFNKILSLAYRKRESYRVPEDLE
jgi:PD-(D/E)XK nuclease superfamily